MNLIGFITSLFKQPGARKKTKVASTSLLRALGIEDTDLATRNRGVSAGKALGQLLDRLEMPGRCKKSVNCGVCWDFLNLEARTGVKLTVYTRKPHLPIMRQLRRSGFMGCPVKVKRYPIGKV